jgi:hypothetical protein
VRDSCVWNQRARPWNSRTCGSASCPETGNGFSFVEYNGAEVRRLALSFWFFIQKCERAWRHGWDDYRKSTCRVDIEQLFHEGILCIFHCSSLAIEQLRNIPGISIQGIVALSILIVLHLNVANKDVRL